MSEIEKLQKLPERVECAEDPAWTFICISTAKKCQVDG